MKKEDDGAVPLSLPPPPIAAATVARPRRPPQMMLVFSRFSPKKVPFEDTTEAVVVEAEAAARRARVCDQRTRAMVSNQRPKARVAQSQRTGSAVTRPRTAWR